MNKFKIIILATALMLLAGSAYFMWQSQQAPNFQAYSPSKLPGSITVTDHETFITTSHTKRFKEVVINTNVKGLYIGQEKSTFEEYQLTTHSCASKSVNVDCVELKTKQGQTFAVSTSYNQDKAFDQTISWHKGQTRFWIHIPKDYIHKFSNESWGTAIDGFTFVDYGSEPGKQLAAQGA